MEALNEAFDNLTLEERAELLECLERGLKDSAEYNIIPVSDDVFTVLNSEEYSIDGEET
jgi:hypothetical protein